MSRLGMVLSGVAVALAAIVYYYGLDGSIPARTNYRLDLETARALAEAPADELPYEIRMEVLARTQVPCFAIRAGCLGPAFMTRPSFQIVTPAGYYMLETGMDLELAKAHNQHQGFDEQIWANIQAALTGAVGIIATHEHPEHVAGVVRHRDPASLAGKLQFTREQFDMLAEFAPGGGVPDAFAGETIIDLKGPHLIAPGIVMIPAPGHTPGSVLFFVKMNTGQEVLFVGDIAYTYKNITDGVDRPRFVRFLMVTKEDRGAIVNQLRTLNNLSKIHPDILIVPAHGDELLTALVDQGFIKEGFAEMASEDE